MIPFLVLTGLVVGLAGCGSTDEGASGGVVAAFYPLAYAAQQVDGGASVTNLTPSGAEPHDLELTARDVSEVRDAAMVFYLGEGFQPSLEAAITGRTGPSLDVLDGLGLLRGTGERADRLELDPHVWLDPLLFAEIARAMAVALGHPAAADELVARLHELDREFAAGLKSCRRRQIVTSHAAFGYLAKRYDLVQVPLSGLSPEAEPTPRALEDAVADVRATGATTIFFETLLSPALAETVARQTGATTAVLNPLEGLTQDQIDAGDDYFSVMRENLAALREALECSS
jgi:zinc transport system substrate-binding protein